MVWIAGQTVTGSASALAFSSISQSFTHLQLKVFVRGQGSAANAFLGLQFNNDSGGNYGFGYHILQGDGASATSINGGGTGYTAANLGYIPAASATSGIFGVAIIDILDYTNTNKNKVIRALVGYDANGSGVATLGSGLWINTSAINQLTVSCNVSPFSLAVGSRVDLYGITSSQVTGA